jgi:hypothetical protein
MRFLEYLNLNSILKYRQNKNAFRFCGLTIAAYYADFDFVLAPLFIFSDLAKKKIPS